MLKPKPNYVSIFFGHFQTEAEFENYLHENFGRESDEVPISEFACELGVTWIDHDLVEAEYRAGEEKVALTEMARYMSYSSSYLSELEAMSHANRYGNAIVLLFDQEYKSHASSAELKLGYVGVFPYSRRAPAAREA